MTGAGAVDRTLPRPAMPDTTNGWPFEVSNAAAANVGSRAGARTDPRTPAATRSPQSETKLDVRAPTSASVFASINAALDSVGKDCVVSFQASAVTGMSQEQSDWRDRPFVLSFALLSASPSP